MHSTKKLFFSIITPTYNRSDKIGKAIESLLDQEYEHFELIIVDDGSTDNTEEIVKSYNDPRIFYYKKENEERNIARNFGIKKASGDYVGFLDSDDLLYSNHLKVAYRLIVEKKNPEVIHLNFEILQKSSSKSLLSKKHLRNLNDYLIAENILHCNSIFIKKEVANNIHFLNSSNAIVGEDYYLWLKLSARYKIHLSMIVTNAVVDHKKRSLNNIDVNKLNIGTNEIYQSLKNDKEFINYYGWKANRYFSYNYVFLALHLAISKRKSEAINNLVTALSIYPASVFSRRFLAVIKNLYL